MLMNRYRWKWGFILDKFTRKSRLLLLFFRIEKNFMMSLSSSALVLAPYRSPVVLLEKHRFLQSLLWWISFFHLLLKKINTIFLKNLNKKYKIMKKTKIFSHCGFFHDLTIIMLASSPKGIIFSSWPFLDGWYHITSDFNIRVTFLFFPLEILNIKKNQHLHSEL